MNVLKRTTRAAAILVAVGAGVGIVSAQDTGGIDVAFLKGRPYSPYADRAFPTNVYFGDTHVHTSLSADAGGGGTTLGPAMPTASLAASRSPRTAASR